MVKYFIWGVGGFLLLLMVLFGLDDAGIFADNSVVEVERKVPRVGEVPKVQIPLFDGQTVNTHDFSGKIVILNFWASWCAPCLEEFPEMLAIAEKHKEQVVLLTVSNDERLVEAMRFIRSFGTRSEGLIAEGVLILGWDRDLSIAQNWFNVLKLPETFIVNQDKAIVEKIVGAQRWQNGDVAKIVERLIEKN